jgi:hypothetical protein
MPKTTDMDDDSWMEVNSLEELEEEMKTLSSRKVNADSDATTTSGRPRRTTRRSRVGRKFARESCEEDEQDAQPKDDAEALNKILAGFRSFVEGEGELEGAVTTCVKDSSQQQESRHRDSSELDPENLMSQEVSIDPRIFLNTLHSMLSNQSTPQPESNPDENHDDISKFFFQEDLDDGDTSDEERGSGFIIDEDTDNSRPPYGPDQDHWSVQNYMVSDKKRQKIFVLEFADLYLIDQTSNLLYFIFVTSKEAMDHELRTGAASDPSIKNLSVASGNNNDVEDGRDSVDQAILSNLLSSLDAEGVGSGPVSNILREMGICPPRLHDDDD